MAGTNLKAEAEKAQTLYREASHHIKVRETFRLLNILSRAVLDAHAACAEDDEPEVVFTEADRAILSAALSKHYQSLHAVAAVCAGELYPNICTDEAERTRTLLKRLLGDDHDVLNVKPAATAS